MTVTGLQHVLVLSDDIDETRDFYCEIIGLTVGDRPALPFTGYWLYADGVPCVHVADRTSYGASSHRLGLSVPDAPGGRGPIDHIAFIADDYEAAAALLAARGVDAVAAVLPSGPRQLFFDDPNGVRVESQVARTPDTE
jgi:catechol 2,3-dioxygenase-like lactoylglutathione lyase family enzyme